MTNELETTDVKPGDIGEGGVEITQEDIDKGYYENTWAGLPNYQCMYCPTAFLAAEFDMATHVQEEHMVGPPQLQFANMTAMQQDLYGQLIDPNQKPKQQGATARTNPPPQPQREVTRRTVEGSETSTESGQGNMPPGTGMETSSVGGSTTEQATFPPANATTQSSQSEEHHGQLIEETVTVRRYEAE